MTHPTTHPICPVCVHANPTLRLWAALWSLRLDRPERLHRSPEDADAVAAELHEGARRMTLPGEEPDRAAILALADAVTLLGESQRAALAARAFDADVPERAALLARADRLHRAAYASLGYPPPT